jgi:hypothetical protein
MKRKWKINIEKRLKFYLLSLFWQKRVEKKQKKCSRKQMKKFFVLLHYNLRKFSLSLPLLPTIQTFFPQIIFLRFSLSFGYTVERVPSAVAFFFWLGVSEYRGKESYK